jgi:hypothetical protein
MNARRSVEAVAVGVWLALAQVALGFALMAGAGASASLFFALTAAWLAGGAAGAIAAHRLPCERLLAAALVSVATAECMLAFAPFSVAATGAGLAAE